MTRYIRIRYYNKCSKCRTFIWTQARISISIRQSPHQQQSIVRQIRPQSDVASVVLSNVQRIKSKWSSSTTCWEFFHQFTSAITLKLIQITFVKYDHLRTDPLLRLMPSAANGYYGINLSWCAVLSNSQATNVNIEDSL